MSTRPAGEPASAPLLDGLPGIFYVLSERGAMLRWNDRFESVSGYSTAELAAMLPGEVAKWADVIRTANVAVE